MPFDSNCLDHVHSLCNFSPRYDLIFKQAICEQGKVLFSHLCDLKLEALILLISSEPLPYTPLSKQEPFPRRTHTCNFGARGGGWGTSFSSFSLF